MQRAYLVCLVMALLHTWCVVVSALPSQKFVTEFHVPDSPESNQDDLAEQVLTLLQGLTSIQLFLSNVTVTPT